MIYHFSGLFIRTLNEWSEWGLCGRWCVAAKLQNCVPRTNLDPPSRFDCVARSDCFSLSALAENWILTRGFGPAIKFHPRDIHKPFFGITYPSLYISIQNGNPGLVCSLSRCSFNFAWSFDVNSKFHKQGSFSSSSRAICSSRRKVPITGNRGISKFLAVVQHSYHFQFVLSYQASEIQMDRGLLRLPLTLIFFWDQKSVCVEAIARTNQRLLTHASCCIKVSNPAKCVWQKHGLLILNMCPAREFVCVPSFSLPPSSRRSVLAGSHNSRNRRRRRFCNCFFAWWAGRLVQTADRQT